MKKIYIQPTITIEVINESLMAGVSFGDGSTGNMHSKQSSADWDSEDEPEDTKY